MLCSAAGRAERRRQAGRASLESRAPGTGRRDWLWRAHVRPCGGRGPGESLAVEQDRRGQRRGAVNLIKALLDDGRVVRLGTTAPSVCSRAATSSARRGAHGRDRPRCHRRRGPHHADVLDAEDGAALERVHPGPTSRAERHRDRESSVFCTGRAEHPRAPVAPRRAQAPAQPVC